MKEKHIMEPVVSEEITLEQIMVLQVKEVGVLLLVTLVQQEELAR